MHLIKARNNSGQTIIEAVAALAIILAILAAISVAITSSVNNSSYIRSQSLAGKYAQQGMEAVRYIRNNDPVQFNVLALSTQAYCMGSDNNLETPGAACITVNLPEGLIREVLFLSNSGNCSAGTKVTVNVYWSSGKCPSTNRFCHKSQVISCFADQSESGITL